MIGYTVITSGQGLGWPFVRQATAEAQKNDQRTCRRARRQVARWAGYGGQPHPSEVRRALVPSRPGGARMGTTPRARNRTNPAEQCRRSGTNEPSAPASGEIQTTPAARVQTSQPPIPRHAARDPTNPAMQRSGGTSDRRSQTNPAARVQTNPAVHPDPPSRAPDRTRRCSVEAKPAIGEPKRTQPDPNEPA
jgi:hypothetical protein